MSDQSAPTLPTSERLNIAALAGLFRHTTNSYKFVFFLALLELLQRHRFDADRPYTYAEITVEMLATAWFAHTFFKLSFGTQDTIAKKLDALTLGIGDKPVVLAGDRATLRTALAGSDLRQAGRLMDFVPYRLLIPFLEPQLRHVDKGAWMVFEHAMPAITNAHFEMMRPLYRFDSDDYSACSAIRWHPDWVQYLEAHHGIIHGWAAWHWLQYMQRRNPATPALANKLFPPGEARPAHAPDALLARDPSPGAGWRAALHLLRRPARRRRLRAGPLPAMVVCRP